MQNINNFILGCHKLGLHKNETFLTLDLFEGKDIPSVVDCLFSLREFSMNSSQCKNQRPNETEQRGNSNQRQNETEQRGNRNQRQNETEQRGNSNQGQNETEQSKNSNKGQNETEQRGNLNQGQNETEQRKNSNKGQLESEGSTEKKRFKINCWW